MQVLHKLSIGRRLALGFGIAVSLMLAMIVIVATLVSGIRDDVVTIVDDRYPNVQLASEIRDRANLQLRLLRNAVIATLVHDEQEHARSLARAEAIVPENGEAMRRLGARLHSAQGKALFKAIEQARAGFGPLRDEVVRLARAGQAEAAARLLFGDARAAQTRYLDALQAMIDFQQGVMREASAEAKHLAGEAVLLTLLLGAVAVLLSVGAAWAITASIVRPLRKAVQVAEAVAAGDLTVRHGEARTHDETGLLLAALQKMTDSLAQVVGTVRHGCESLATASDEISTGSLDLSQRTEEQASALEQTAASMEQLGTTVRQNADNARQANELASGACGVAERSGEAVDEAVQMMQRLHDSSKKIADITGVIDGIAFQTNLLALNAAVEAARAGEQGRGFAVVAGEVRTLAQRSAAAAKEIKTLIASSVEQMAQGTTVVDRAGRTMQETVAAIQRVTVLMGEISTASAEQSQGVGQVAEAVSQMDHVTQQNAALVQQSTAAADSLQQQAAHLARTVRTFTLPA